MAKNRCKCCQVPRHFGGTPLGTAPLPNAFRPETPMFEAWSHHEQGHMKRKLISISNYKPLTLVVGGGAVWISKDSKKFATQNGFLWRSDQSQQVLGLIPKQQQDTQQTHESHLSKEPLSFPLSKTGKFLQIFLNLMKSDGHLAASRSATFQQIRWRWEKHFQCTGDISNASSWHASKQSLLEPLWLAASNGVTHDRKLPSTLPSAASQLTSSTCTLRGVAIGGPRVAKGEHLRSIWNITVDWQGCNPSQVEF